MGGKAQVLIQSWVHLSDSLLIHNIPTIVQQVKPTAGKMDQLCSSHMVPAVTGVFLKLVSLITFAETSFTKITA